MKKKTRRTNKCQKPGKLMRKQLQAPVGEQKLMPNKKKIPKSNARGEPGSTLHKKTKKAKKPRKEKK